MHRLRNLRDPVLLLYPEIMRRVVLAISLLWIACDTPSSIDGARVLADARDRWNARGFPDYSFEMRQSCFCAPETTQWARIEVVDGAVRRVVLVASGAEVTEELFEAFPSIESIFDQLEAEPPAWIERIEAEYDAALGFPTLVTFVAKPEVADADATYYLRNAGPLP